MYKNLDVKDLTVISQNGGYDRCVWVYLHNKRAACCIACPHFADDVYLQWFLCRQCNLRLPTEFIAKSDNQSFNTNSSTK